jgi:hypothetical protein
MKTGVVCQAEKAVTCAPGLIAQIFVDCRDLNLYPYSISNVTTDLLFSQPSGLPPVEDFSEKRQKKGTSGEEKDSDGWDDLRYVSQMPPYLFLLLLRPIFICVPGFHKKLHQSLDRKDFYQDGFLINNDQPSKILFDHRRTTHNPFFLVYTFFIKDRKCSP